MFLVQWTTERLKTLRVRRRPTPWGAAVEPLEGRALLSTAQFLGSPIPPAGVQPFFRTFGTQRGDLTPHIHQTYTSNNGHVSIHPPQFYESYTGPQRPDLLVQTAGATLIHKKILVLSGSVQGPIGAEPAFYTFGIDRGGSPLPGPFPGRPFVRFNSVVTVVPGPDGPSGFVSLLDDPTATPTFTPLPPGSVQVSGSHIQATVPLDLLPSTGAIPQRYFFNLWASSAPTVADPATIASFAPPLTVNQVGLLHHIWP